MSEEGGLTKVSSFFLSLLFANVNIGDDVRIVDVHVCIEERRKKDRIERGWRRGKAIEARAA